MLSIIGAGTVAVHFKSVIHIVRTDFIHLK